MPSGIAPRPGYRDGLGNLLRNVRRLDTQSARLDTYRRRRAENSGSQVQQLRQKAAFCKALQVLRSLARRLLK
jgi:hypothetical protein